MPVNFKDTKLIAAITLLIVSSFWATSCRESETFETLGDRVAGPTAITQNDSNFFVLNADIDRTYNQGSIMILDSDAQKISTIVAPRMGVFLVERENTLIAGFGPTDQFKTKPQLRFYDVSNVEDPKEALKIELDCMPINAYAPPAYAYFAVSCVGGAIYIGEWGTTLAATTLKKVRKPDAITRRALYIDTASNILYAFSTDWGEQRFADRVLTDLNSYDEDFTEVATPNEVPDGYEDSQETVSQLQKSSVDNQYKFMVYDIAKEAAANFPEREIDSPESISEMRWLYFNANRSDLTFDDGQRYYRSNFWMIIPHETDMNSFYISQRGDEVSSKDANAVYKFTLTANPLPVSNVAPTTESFLSVTAVYGHEESPLSTKRFTGNFALASANSQNYFVVNDFKDPGIRSTTDYFDDPSYSVGFTSTDGSWSELLSSTNRKRSYFALGVIGGRALVASYYTDELILLEVSPGSAINTVTIVK